jgi:hypothetical protein
MSRRRVPQGLGIGSGGVVGSLVGSLRITTRIPIGSNAERVKKVTGCGGCAADFMIILRNWRGSTWRFQQMVFGFSRILNPSVGPPSRPREPFLHRASHDLVGKVRRATHRPRASSCASPRPGALRVSRDATGAGSGAPRGSKPTRFSRSRALFRPGRRRLRARGDARRRPHDALLIRVALAANDRDASVGFSRVTARSAPPSPRVAKVLRLLGFSVSIGTHFFHACAARAGAPGSRRAAPRLLGCARAPADDAA